MKNLEELMELLKKHEIDFAISSCDENYDIFKGHPTRILISKSPEGAQHMCRAYEYFMGKEAICLEDPEKTQSILQARETEAVEPNAIEPVHQDDIDKALVLIHESKLPFIIIGEGANYQNISAILTEFIDKSDTLFTHMPQAKGLVDEYIRQHVGNIALATNDLIDCAFICSDLIISIGLNPENLPEIIRADTKKTVLHINPEPWPDIKHQGIMLSGDMVANIKALHDNVNRDQCMYDMSLYDIKNAITECNNDYVGADVFPMVAPRIVHQVREHSFKSNIVIVDHPEYKLWFARNHKAYKPNSMLLDMNGEHSAYGISAAIVARYFYEDEDIVCICSEEAFNNSYKEMKTALEYDFSFSIIVLVSPQSDFSIDAKKLGVRVYIVESADDFSSKLHKANMDGGLHVIIVQTDDRASQDILDSFTKELKCPSKR